MRNGGGCRCENNNNNNGNIPEMGEFGDNMMMNSE